MTQVSQYREWVINWDESRADAVAAFLAMRGEEVDQPISRIATVPSATGSGVDIVILLHDTSVKVKAEGLTADEAEAEVEAWLARYQPYRVTLVSSVIGAQSFRQERVKGQLRWLYDPQGD